MKSQISKHNTKVFIAMSGGVDSSVSAALLKKAGYDVTGVFIKVWQPDFLTCSRGDDRLEAMRVAARLGIPFLTFDFEKEYKKQVIDYMISEYGVGRTPNPDAMCNKHVKFGAFLKRAREMGADLIATGHYARLQREFPISNFQPVRTDMRPGGFPNKFKIQNFSDRSRMARQVKSKINLLAGVDKNKDQSYFLWTLTQEQLRRTLFPIGGYTKPEVRELAREFKLPNAERQESQGLCFIGEFDFKEFLKHYLKEKKGVVLNEKGEKIGFHRGVFFYTIGERHGFTITQKTPHDAPYYVIAKDIKKNTITVSHERIRDRETSRKVFIKNVNFISGFPPNPRKTYRARIRYRQPLQSARIMKQEARSKNKKFIIQFKRPQEAVTDGQSLVLYDGEECLGGGVIV